LTRPEACYKVTNLPPFLWAETISAANYLRNRIPTTKSPRTPFERMFGKTPDLRNLRTFGSVTFAHVPKEKRTSKLE
jgi:hypothetical protein